jgi:hypothetical protein
MQALTVDIERHDWRFTTKIHSQTAKALAVCEISLPGELDSARRGDRQRRELPWLYQNHKAIDRERKLLEMEADSGTSLRRIKVVSARLNYLAEGTPMPMN